MRRTRRSPAARDEGRRFDGVETARDSGRRGGVTAPPLLREQIGQLASRRLWRQKVGTGPLSLGPMPAARRAAAAPRAPPGKAALAGRAPGSGERAAYL